MKKRLTAIIFFVTVSVCAATAQRAWTLEECIAYAIENNISVQQMNIRVDNQRINLNTAQNSRLPNLSAGLSGGASFGRGETRDGTYSDNTSLSSSVNASMGVPVFQGGRINNQIAGYKIDLSATLQDMERAKEDVSLNVTNYFLSAVLAKELVAAAERQLVASSLQFDKNKALFEAGRSPEADMIESRAVVAQDENTLTERKNNLIRAILDLAHALNLEDKENFDVTLPDHTRIAIENATLPGSIDEIYEYSLRTRPNLIAENLRLQRSEKDLRIAKASYYPTINFSAGVNTGYYYSYATNAVNKSLGDQLSANRRGSLSLSVNIPIFNRFATRNNVRTASNAIRTQELAIKDAEINLRKEIERCYYAAEASWLKYHTASELLEASEAVLKNETVKADLNVSTSYDYAVAKNRVESSESQKLQAKYEFIFNRMILDFYSGKPLGNFGY